MRVEDKISTFWTIFHCRIYRLFLAVVFSYVFPVLLFAQEINSYRTAISGFYSDPSTWEIFDGTFWIPASNSPNQNHDIYIDQNHTLTFDSDQEAKSVYINAEASATQKLNLNGYSLEIYGSLNAFSGAAPGTPSGTWNSQNWIGNSLSSELIFRGNSRVIIPRNSWSGFSTQSRYSVIFDPGPGQSLTVEEPFKALQFTVRSGTIIQDLDTSVDPSTCSSFSFNTEGIYGGNEFGDFIIESGGRLISKCNEEIIFRSNTRSAALFDLQDGGELVLEGDLPEMEVANYQLEGKVIFQSGTTQKDYISSSFGGSTLPIEVYDLELNSIFDLQLPSDLTITGDLIQSSTGEFIASSSSLTFSGIEDQDISGFPLIPLNIILNKPSGEVTFSNDLAILSHLEMISGGMNLLGNDLSINLLNSGSMNYQGGYWKSIGLFTYNSLPPTLDIQSGTFPFLDSFQGGIRKIQLLGNTPGGNLSISFSEYKGAEYNSDFNDSDGTPILYRLFSYFEFSNFLAGSEPVELRISADQLIVDDEDDLRIVGTGYAASGNHLHGLDLIELWARRSLSFSDLTGVNFTVGSMRTLSVLPVSWLEIKADRKEKGVQLKWKLGSESENKNFEIYRSSSKVGKWEKVGEKASLGNTSPEREYNFYDNSAPMYQDVYYKIRQVDFSENYSWSPLVLIRKELPTKIKVFPNPHHQGEVKIIFPKSQKNDFSQFEVIGLTNVYHRKQEFEKAKLESLLSSLSPGIYLILLESPDYVHRIRWIKK